jgi:signal transduction histidine kinase
MIRKSLQWKLILAFLLIAVTTAGLVALSVRLTSIDRLMLLIIDQQRSSLQTSLVNYYNKEGSWAAIEKDWDQIRASAGANPAEIINNPSLPSNPGGPPHDRRKLFGLADAQGKVLIPINPGFPRGTNLSSDTLMAGTPVMVNNFQVGTILTASWQPGLNPEENLFLTRTNEALALAFGGATLVALLIGILLSRTLLQPIRALTQAARNITEGKPVQQVKVNSRDEIGQLAVAFNRMSQEVTRVNQLRRQMTADIAHDLRTPLTVIAGYIESMRDGDLDPTPDRLSLIYSEIDQLQKLVSDLRMLSQADAGELSLIRQTLSPKYLLERAAAPFQHRAEQQGIRLEVTVEENLPDIQVDEARMMQVFGNLISNALRYATPGGKIQLLARCVDGKVILSVQDDGSGIAAEELPFIFDRFHRSDKSRFSEEGETGLGLAIVKSLVEAHGGSVSAESAPGSGTSINIALNP